MTVQPRSPTRLAPPSQSTNITNGKHSKKGQCCSRTFTLIRSAGIDPIFSLFRLLAQTSLYAGAGLFQMARDTFCPRKPPKAVNHSVRRAKQTSPEAQPTMRKPASSLKGKIQPVPKAKPAIYETAPTLRKPETPIKGKIQSAPKTMPAIFETEAKKPVDLKSCLHKDNLTGKVNNKTVSFAKQGLLYTYDKNQVANTTKGLDKLRSNNTVNAGNERKNTAGNE